MSESGSSGSSSSSATASDRDETSSQPPAPGTAADDDDSYEDYLIGNKPPEYGAEGLIVLWDAQGGDDQFYRPSAPPVRDFDIVVVHGLHGARRPPWKNPGSGDSSWVDELGRQNGRKVMSFGYDALNMLSGSRTWRSIRRISIRLLEDLKKERASAEKRRPIMFVAHDIGGIIVKDALTYAGLYPSLYGEVFDYTRILVFYGCPHQSVDRLDMEDRLSRFLLSHFDRNAPQLQGTLASTKGLTTAVLDINHLFIDSKHVYRSHVISVYNDDDESQIDKVFDSFSGTLGVPFERRLAGGIKQAHDMDEIEPHLVKIHNQATPDDSIIEHERTLLSIARPTAALTTADSDDHPFAWIGENETYKSWSRQNVPQLLYLHGSSGVRQAAEFAFYDLDNTLRSKENVNEMVLFFTFDRHDIRHDTTEDMLTTFLAQIICHNPSLSEFVTNQFERLALDRSWSDYDLLTWFEYYRVRGQVDGVSCVINCFEECEEESRKAFLELVTKLSKTHERPWRIIVTSRERGTLSDELKDWPSIDLDSATSSSREVDAKDMWMTSAKELFRLRPELKESPAVEAELLKISQLDPSIRDLVLAQVSRHSQWPRKETVESILGPLAELSVSGIFDRVVAAIPKQDREFALRALSWIVCAPRPLSAWELGMALFIGSEGDDGGQARPDYQYVEQVVPKIVDWFAGIVALEIHEIRLTAPHFRDLIIDKANASPNWDGKFVDAVNKDIVETCLNFLLRPHVRKVLEDVYGKGKDKSSVMELPTMSDRCNFCSFAVSYWLYHLQQIPSEAGESDVLHKFIRSESVPIWSKAYWALANPITRSPDFFPSIYPILTGCGLGDLAEPLRENDKDLSAGLIEACLNGFPEVVRDLLGRVKHGEWALQDALIAAGSKGNEEVWKLVIHHVREHYERFMWPFHLLSRASWLGLTDIVKELLEVGCDPNPTNTIQDATPLHLASRNGHVDVVKLLLDHKADVKHRGQYGRTVVSVATVFGHADVIEVLVNESDVDINAKDEENVTAVYVGSLWGNWKAVETLVKLGADPNLGDQEPGVPQWNPLVSAVEEGHFQCVKALLDAGADPNFVGVDGTAVRYAVSSGRIDMVRMLIEKKADLHHEKIDPPILMYAINSPRIESAEARLEMVRLLLDSNAKLDVVDEDGETPLCRAISTGDADVIPLVSYLLGRGVDVNGLSGSNKETPLHLAIRQENAELARLLIEKGANVNPPLEEGNTQGTPAHLAVYNPEMLELLLEKGADITVKSDKGVVSVLTQATLANNTRSIEILLKHKAPLEDEDPTYADYTALAFAANYGYPQAFRLLADAGADLSHRVSQSRTVLHLAVNDKDTLPACLEYRPPIDVQDDDGDTPLHTVGGWTPTENVRLLVRAGARLDITNKEGLTPLSHAIKDCSPDVAEYLLSKSTPEVINAVSDIHGSALHIACSNAKLGLVKLLLEKDVDVNLAVNSVVGTPLQSTILCINGAPVPVAAETDDIAAIVDLLIDAGADVSAVGGQFGTAVAAAALQGSATLLRNLLEKGGKPDVPDPMGRLPVHLASVHGADHFGVILDADVGDAHALVKDKAGRTPLHWAAQGGQVSVVEKILDMASDKKVVDQADNDGWTPLCWAARSSGTHFSVLSVEKQVDVIKKLIERGAKVDYKVPGQDKRPIDIARYHAADKEVLDLLDTDAKEKPKVNGEKKDDDEKDDDEKDDDEKDDDEKDNDEKDDDEKDDDEKDDDEKDEEEGDGDGDEEKKEVLFQHHNAYCAYCLSDIAGFLYKCETCADLSLCYKCYESRTAFHAAHHTFKQVGPEFLSPSEAGSRSSSRQGGGTDSETADVDDEEDGSDDDSSEEDEDEDNDDSDDE